MKALRWIRYFTISLLLALAWTVSADMLPPPEDPNTKYVVTLLHENGSVEVMNEPTDYESAKNLYFLVLGDGNVYQMFKVAEW